MSAGRTPSARGLSTKFLATAVAAVVALGFAGRARADDPGAVELVRESIIALDLEGARHALDGASRSDPALTLERGRLALYEGQYDAAAEILASPELSHSDDAAELLGIARGCARATAAAVSTHDDKAQVDVRFQDEDDRALAPFLVDIASRARAALARDLGVELPRPLRIEVVRDLFTLAAMTGLPESAAQTTGTVAVAKWGRVTMISPRAVPHGYPWADTLAHEMAHLAQTMASGDRAPLWLQEGVAKREETRWRDPRAFDQMPAPDSIAAIGLEKGLGRPIDKLGASIAMLPSAEQAMVAFAEVESFVAFWVRTAGDQALPGLLRHLKTASVPEAPSPGAQSHGPDPVDAALQAVSGASLGTWNTRWMAYLNSAPRELSPDLAIGAAIPHEGDLRRGLALGELLRARSHHAAAAKVFGRVQPLSPFDPVFRHHLAAELLASGDPAKAERLVENAGDVHSEYGPWYALHGHFQEAQSDLVGAEKSFELGIFLAPLREEVACRGKDAPDVPSPLLLEALCRAARGATVMLRD